MEDFKAETPARATGKAGNFSADDGKQKKEDYTSHQLN